MPSFAYPWLLLLIPLFVGLGWLLPAYRESRPALRVPFLQRLSNVTGREARAGAVIPRTPIFQRIQILLCTVLFVTALARPQWLGEPIVKQVPTRDLLLSVDLSGSMDTRDFESASGETVNRLDAVKEVLDEFLAKREGDRVALVVFGNAAFLQVPFTQDLDACRMLLEEAQVGMAGPKTALGDSIGLAIQLFRSSEVEKKVIIALTDGNDTGSQVTPDNAARIARDEGILIHTVAVGDPEAAGEEKLDEDALKKVAQITGGTFYHADDREELGGIYDELDALETREVDTVSHRPRFDIFWIPLAAGLLLNLLFHLVHALRYGLRHRTSPAPAPAPLENHA